MAEGLDFSGLTDDQLVELIRGTLQEVARRHPATVAAARDAWIDEEEKARIRIAATEQEVRAARARERERIATEARAKVQAEHAARTAGEDARRRAETAAAEAEARRIKAKADAEAATRWEAIRRKLVARAAELVGVKPWKICVVVYRGDVFLNLGDNRFSKEHLVEYRSAEKRISTNRNLIRRKPELIEFCAELLSIFSDAALFGSLLFEPEPETQEAQP